MPLADDDTLFFGRYGERRSVDDWQPSHHELYDPVELCPAGAGPDDPKDCPQTRPTGIP